MKNELATGRMILDIADHTLIKRIASAVDEYRTKVDHYPNFAYVHPDHCEQPCDIYLNDHCIHIEPNPFMGKQLTWIGLRKEARA